ncbi:hypothetical protein [Streptomyces sp. NPDC050287]
MTKADTKPAAEFTSTSPCTEAGQALFSQSRSEIPEARLPGADTDACP